MPNWRETTSTGNDPVWDYKNLPAGSSIEGTYTSMKENVGINNSRIYKIKTDKGMNDVWGCTSLDMKMDEISKGSLVKIVYEGKKESDKRKGKQFHAFRVFFDDSNADILGQLDGELPLEDLDNA